MILGPSGKNIYPEEIESVFNNEKYIVEAVVIEENNKLVALIFPDFEQLKNDNIPQENIPSVLDDLRKKVNERLPDYMAVSKIRIQTEEFAKTPKRSIRRFLYTGSDL